MLAAMFRRRCVGYRAIGYDIMDPAKDVEAALPDDRTPPVSPCQQADLFGPNGVADGV